MAMQRAQDKIASMQARAGAVDELLASGALTDLTGSSDPLQAELDKTSQQSPGRARAGADEGRSRAAPPAGALGAGSPAAAAADSDAAPGDGRHAGRVAGGAATPAAARARRASSPAKPLAAAGAAERSSR